MDDVVNAKLDVITVMIIDDDTRVVVMEGLAGPERAWTA